MPINASLAKSLITKYGKNKAKKIYFGLENEKKPAFQKGLKTASKEGDTTVHFPKKTLKVKKKKTKKTKKG